MKTTYKIIALIPHGNVLFTLQQEQQKICTFCGATPFYPLICPLVIFKNETFLNDDSILSKYQSFFHTQKNSTPIYLQKLTEEDNFFCRKITGLPQDHLFLNQTEFLTKDFALKTNHFMFCKTQAKHNLIEENQSKDQELYVFKLEELNLSIEKFEENKNISFCWQTNNSIWVNLRKNTKI